MTGQYAAYVISAYLIGAGALLGIIGWAVLERRSARASLRRAERAVERQGAARDGA